MKRSFCIIVVLACILAAVIPAAAETRPFKFYGLADYVMHSVNYAEKADNEQMAYFTVLRSVTLANGTTATSNLVDGDMIDFRSLTYDLEYASKMATATRYGNTVHKAYLPGKGIRGDYYYLGARTNPNSAHTGVSVAGQWTP